MNNASPEDSMTFVRRNPNPMKVRKRNAVSAAPSRVDDKGDMAAAGYACFEQSRRAYMSLGLSTHHEDPPSRYYICHSRCNEQDKLVCLAFPNKFPSNLAQLLGDE